MPTIISQNTTWKSGDVINLADDVQVASGVTLKVEPGTTINGNFRTITVFGNLDIKGTLNSNVTTDNLNVDLSSNSKHLGNIHFDYVTFNNGSFLLENGRKTFGSFDVLNSNFTNVRGFYIWFPDAPSTFLGNTFYKSSGLSIGTLGDGSVLIKNNSFVEQSTAYAIESWANFNSGITVVNNSFLSTTKVALALRENSDVAALNAADNYFGTSDLSIINRMIRDKTDSLNYASVISASHTDKPSAGTPIFDSTPPTILLSGNITSVKADEAATITFILNENATDFTFDDISTSGGTLTNFDGFGTNYSAKFTPAANSTINGVISVASGKFSDAAGNFNADGADANNTVTIIVDSLPPSIALTADKSSLKTGETATIKFTLNESSTEFTSADVSVSGGTLINFTGAGRNYTAIFAPTANASGNGLVSVASGKFSDGAGNFNVDGADANNTVTLSIISTRTSALTVLVDKGVLNTEPVLLKDLIEEVTTVGNTVLSHSLYYSGNKFTYKDVDALITTVIRDGNFTEEYRKEITDYLPSAGNISYDDLIKLVGTTSIDGVLISIAGSDNSYVG